MLEEHTGMRGGRKKDEKAATKIEKNEKELQGTGVLLLFGMGAVFPTRSTQPSLVLYFICHDLFLPPQLCQVHDTGYLSVRLLVSLGCRSRCFWKMRDLLCPEQLPVLTPLPNRAVLPKSMLDLSGLCHLYRLQTMAPNSSLLIKHSLFLQPLNLGLATWFDLAGGPVTNVTQAET